MIKQVAQTAGFAGLLAALLLTLLQSVWVSPLIFQAESYESAPPAIAHDHDHDHAHAASGHSHAHDEDAWAPADGWQRLLFTALSNLVVAVGFALMLAGLYVVRTPQKTWQGLLWGLAGFAAFSLAPAVGLPPEMPGAATADLVLRQYWWVATAAATAVGLGLLAFGRHWALRVVGLILLPIPHLIGAPHPHSHDSLVPAALAQEFVYASLFTNAAFWIVLGFASAWFFARSQRAD